MPAPATRYKILPARGAYAALNAAVSEIQEGEICYASDQDQYYQKEGNVLVPVGASKAQGDLADTALQPGDNVSELVNDAGYLTTGTLPDLVTSVNGQTGDVVLDHTDVGAVSQVDFDARVIEVDTALSNKADLVNGVVPNSQLPSVAITEYLGEVANETEMLALSGEKGDWCIRMDTSSTWVLTGEPASSIDSWVELATPASAVTSVNGYTGAVTLSAADVGATEEAPTDGIQYVRQDGAWSAVDVPPGTIVDDGSGLPATPGDGQLWFNTDDGRLYVYFTDVSGDSQWVDASPGGGGGGSASTVSDTPPSDPSEGDIWWDSSDAVADNGGRLYIYYGSQWVQASNIGTGGGSGGGIEEAPNDGKQYGRQNEEWTEIVGGGGGEPGVRYQQGTWTPTFSQGSMALNDMSWVRVGNLVTIQGRINNSTDTSTSQPVQINAGSLPYGPVLPSSVLCIGSVGGAFLGKEINYLQMQSGGALRFTKTAGSETSNTQALQYNDLGTSHNILFTGSYITDDTTFDAGDGSEVTVDIQGTGDGGSGGGSGSGADAWGSFEGGAPGALINGMNIAETKRTSSGTYEVTFRTAMPNSTYAVTAVGNSSAPRTIQVRNKTTSGFKVLTTNPVNSALTDGAVSFAVHASNAIAPQAGVGADAWILSDGSGNREGSFNASVSRTQEGIYQVTFNQAMPTADYAVTCAGQSQGNILVTSYEQTTSGFKINTRTNTGDNYDFPFSAVVHASSTVTPTYTWTREGTTVKTANSGDNVEIGTRSLGDEGISFFANGSSIQSRISGDGSECKIFTNSKTGAKIFGLGVGDDASATSAQLNTYLWADGTADFYTPNNSNATFIRFYSDIGGTKTEKIRFVTNGDAFKPGGGSWGAISDSRSKNSITPYTSGLAELSQVETVKYKYNGLDKEYVGIIAQQVESVMPELVSVGPGTTTNGEEIEDLRSVDQTPLTFALINAVKEMAARIEALEAKVQQLEGSDS